jgi:hypothetical protein
MYTSKKAATAFLESVLEYLGSQTFTDSGRAAGSTGNWNWFIDIADARTLVKDAIIKVAKADIPKRAKTPVEKATVAEFAIVDPSVDLLTPVATVVVIDGDKLEREVLKESISDLDVQRLLPFQTRLVMGENHIHIENASAYTVETQYHLISEGDTLCAKQGQTYRTMTGLVKVATCPGCLAKAKGVIVNHLLNTGTVR